MPILHVCRCGAELSLRFDEVRSANSRRVEGYGFGLDDVFGFLHGDAAPAHDLVDTAGEVLAAGNCQMDHEREGDCNLCGECCRYVFQSISEEEAGDPDRGRWLELRGGRVDRIGYGAWDVLVHPCQALVEEGPDRFVCGIYRDRPQMCQRWPEHPWDIEPYPKCGFRFKPKAE